MSEPRWKVIHRPEDANQLLHNGTMAALVFKPYDVDGIAAALNDADTLRQARNIAADLRGQSYARHPEMIDALIRVLSPPAPDGNHWHLTITDPSDPGVKTMEPLGPFASEEECDAYKAAELVWRHDLARARTRHRGGGVTTLPVLFWRYFAAKRRRDAARKEIIREQEQGRGQGPRSAPGPGPGPEGEGPGEAGPGPGPRPEGR